MAMTTSKQAASVSASVSREDLDSWIELLKNECQLIPENSVKALCLRAAELMNLEPNLVNVESPVTVCGDTRGQFYDLVDLFKVGGECPDTNYLFLGNYVNRGYHSVQTILLLLALKVRYPERITLLRGHYETRGISQVFGFYDECVRKYGNVNVWNYCVDVFDMLPLAAMIDSKMYCVHAGAADPQICSLDDIMAIERKQEPPHNDCPMVGMLWNDPWEDRTGFMPVHGTGYLFGGDMMEKFRRQIGVDLICRGHQLKMEGYQTMFDGTLVTIFSAPNFAYRCGNLAAILELDEHLNKTYKVFGPAPQHLNGRGSQQKTASKADYFI